MAELSLNFGSASYAGTSFEPIAFDEKAYTRSSAQRGNLVMQDREALNELLVRWHRWSADPSASGDLMMPAFDAIVGDLPRGFIAALIVEARNKSCGAAVWSSVRAGTRESVKRARYALWQRLGTDQTLWFGGEVVKFSDRGNRIGDSNPSAKVPDRTVELCVQMRDQRHPETGKPLYTLGQLALRFKVPKSTVQAWCEGRNRGQAPARTVKAKA